MKITFSNLGAIKKTTLDLRPLTVIIGPNNSNKTYIAYSIYGLWDSIVNKPYLSLFEMNVTKVDKNTYSVKIDETFYDFLVKNCFQKIKSFKDDLENFFQDSSRKIFKQTNYELNLSRKAIKSRLIKLKEFSVNLPVGKIKFNVENNLLFIKFEIKDLKDNLLFDGESNAALALYFTTINLLFPSPFLLPAERNAFIITYKILASNRLKNLRLIQRERISARSERELELLREQGVINYPQPIEDFLDFLTDVEFEKNIVNNSAERKKFCELANKIEESIQGKNKTNFKPTKFGGKEIKINIKKGLDIDLYNASSSIKQLAPLLLYLRYRAEENDLLIIDEPEMNLHPESQSKLLEVLGMLVNAGINVLLTTHSPYFMSHLNNLIAGDMNDNETREKQAQSLYLGDSRAFLKPEDVSAYEMRQNKAGNQTLHDLKDKDYGIRWDTLSDVSADIQQKFFEIYEKGEETSKGKEK